MTDIKGLIERAKSIACDTDDKRVIAELTDAIESLTQPVGMEPVANVNAHNVNQIDWLDMFSAIGCGDALFSESQLRQVMQERDEEKMVGDKWCKTSGEFKEQCITLQSQVEMLREAAAAVVANHDKILPIMAAYMGTLGTTTEWEQSCKVSDLLREALAATEESK